MDAPRRSSNWLCLLPAIVSWALLFPTAGYRHIWQDEAETAERARSIVEQGLPRVVDAQGRVSVNTGGLEIEEGTLHRYTPWGQFYLGAVGLAVGKPLGLSDDAALRAPFILLHGAGSSLMTYGLVTLAGLAPPAAIVVGTVFSLQSVRLLHNRTARYHVLLDFLVIVGVLGLGFLRIGCRREGAMLLAFAIFLLPHSQTLGGSLLASTLGFMALLLSSLKRDGRLTLGGVASGLKENFFAALLPGVVSLSLLMVLSRPWLQGHWAMKGPTTFRSLRSGFEVAYAFYPYVIAMGFLFWKKARGVAIAMLVLLLYVLLVGRALDLHPFSQSRYYLAVPIIFLFWFIPFGRPEEIKLKDGWVAGLLAVGLLLPDTQGVIPPFQGLRVLASDFKNRLEKQPLHQAVGLIKATGDQGAVLFDYVPQLANWYLRERPIALLPDKTNQSKLSLENPVWQTPGADPVWHLRMVGPYNGFWNCSPDCDIHYKDDTGERYVLEKRSTGESFEMCVIASWPTDRWNNAPFSMYEHEALEPAGKAQDRMVLARRCQK